MTRSHPPPGVQPERINLNDKATTAAWARKLDATWEQLREAVAAVGDKACNVEQHLKLHPGSGPLGRVTKLNTTH